jgi:pimeloyl-ACP methyl ester carboxylesterase
MNPSPRGRHPAAGETIRGAVGQVHAVIRLPGGEMTYTTAGSGEPLLLIHGLGGTRDTWSHIIDDLALTHTVIAPDLPGHGASASPAGDYSLGAHATALRDLLIALGHHSATVIGHSLGGGIGLQFAYQFPERTNRLILISSGGLGPDLTLMLRAATLPGASTIVAGLARVPEGLNRRALWAASVLPGFASPLDARPLARGLRVLHGPRQRRAFINTARTVINWQGQMVSATEQLGLLADMPVLVAWGSDDQTIPPHHHQAVAHFVPDVRTVEISAAGHYPHETAAERLLPHLRTFLATTTPFQYNEERWRNTLNQHRSAQPPADNSPEPLSPPAF